MSKISLAELDVIFISYDEPNCEENYADLLSKVPWAKRVHGVHGSDAAHKAAAALSETDRFIGIDADNIVDERFFDIEFDFENPKFKDKVISWTAKNEINGLEYGNGGLKCWPVEYVMKMRTHEAALDDDPHGQVDFCWEDDYVQMNNRYCTTYPNGSCLQAFRAGFREGVKMTLHDGQKLLSLDNFEDSIWWGNYIRLMVWQTVGADVVNGLWAVYGARLGSVMTNLSDWDFVQVRDFEHLNDFFKNEVMPKFATENGVRDFKTGYTYDEDKLKSEIAILGERIRKELGMDVAELDEQQSRFFKRTYVNLPRTGVLVTEADMNNIRLSNR